MSTQTLRILADRLIHEHRVTIQGGAIPVEAIDAALDGAGFPPSYRVDLEETVDILLDERAIEAEPYSGE